MHQCMQPMRDNANVDLPSRLRACLEHWHLQFGNRLVGGSRCDVFTCTTSTGEEVILKLTGTSDEARAEAAALIVWDGTGAAVRLIDVDIERCALLLDRIRPGTPFPSGDDPVALKVVADLLGTLHQFSPGSLPFPALEQTYVESERRSREDAAYEQRTSGDPARGVAGLKRLDAARAVAMYLCATAPRSVLLHGDFLDKNLLWNGTRYVAIDPSPRIGDPCADIGDFAAEQPPATGILARAAAVAARLDLDPRRAQRWAAVRTVLLTSAAWRSDQDELEACLSSGTFERLLSQ